MNDQLRGIRNPRCFLVYALAPDGMPASQANRVFNEFLAVPGLPLAIYHDHFIGDAGAVAIFYVEGPEERDALLDQTYLEGWRVQYRPLIFSRSPSGFDEQIAFTLRAYRDVDWERMRSEDRPSFGDPAREAETAREDYP